MKGVTFRHVDKVISTPSRLLIEDLDSLPMPGYHFVEDHLDRYHFRMMAGNKRDAIIEGSRGCSHNCNFCSQHAFWDGRWRAKSGKRIAEEMEYCHNRFGSEFIWLTDDNFAFGPRADRLFNELVGSDLGDDILWFVQARVDDVMRRAREAVREWVGAIGCRERQP